VRHFSGHALGGPDGEGDAEGGEDGREGALMQHCGDHTALYMLYNVLPVPPEDTTNASAAPHV